MKITMPETITKVEQITLWRATCPSCGSYVDLDDEPDEAMECDFCGQYFGNVLKILGKGAPGA